MEFTSLSRSLEGFVSLINSCIHCMQPHCAQPLNSQSVSSPVQCHYETQSSPLSAEVPCTKLHLQLSLRTGKMWSSVTWLQKNNVSLTLLKLFFNFDFFPPCTPDLKASTLLLGAKSTLVKGNGDKYSLKVTVSPPDHFCDYIDSIFYCSVWLHSLFPFTQIM